MDQAAHDAVAQPFPSSYFQVLQAVLRWLCVHAVQAVAAQSWQPQTPRQ